MLKKLSKNIFLIMLLILVTISFCACGSVRAMIIANSDGTIDELVTISLNTEEMIANGYTSNKIQALKSDIETTSILSAEEFPEKLNNKIQQDLLLTNDQETIETLNSFKNGIDVVKSNWSNNNFTIGIRFKDINVYNYYYDKGEVSVEQKVDKGFWYNKIYYYANNIYNSNNQHRNLYNTLNIVYNQKFSAYPELLQSKNNQLLYTYVTDISRLHSDANYVSNIKGQYYHTWEVDPEDIEQPVMFYYNIANPENWILVSVGITLVITVVLVLVGIVIKISTINKVNKKDSSE